MPLLRGQRLLAQVRQQQSGLYDRPLRWRQLLQQRLLLRWCVAAADGLLQRARTAALRTPCCKHHSDSVHIGNAKCPCNPRLVLAHRRQFVIKHITCRIGHERRDAQGPAVTAVAAQQCRRCRGGRLRYGQRSATQRPAGASDGAPSASGPAATAAKAAVATAAATARLLADPTTSTGCAATARVAIAIAAAKLSQWPATFASTATSRSATAALPPSSTLSVATAAESSATPSGTLAVAPSSRITQAIAATAIGSSTTPSSEPSTLANGASQNTTAVAATNTPNHCNTATSSSLFSTSYSASAPPVQRRRGAIVGPLHRQRRFVHNECGNLRASGRGIWAPPSPGARKYYFAPFGMLPVHGTCFDTKQHHAPAIRSGTVHVQPNARWTRCRVFEHVPVYLRGSMRKR